MIGITEVLLLSLDYGKDYSTFVKISNQFEDYIFFNPKLPQKYFGNLPITPSVIADGFKREKDSPTFRIFALGGSTTAGYPHPPNGSFPRLLKTKLQEEYPQINFEVINLGISAVNTITIRDIINDVLEEKPDLLLFYAGHNEYYGALGPASNVVGFSNLFITRLVLALKEFKITQLTENIISEIFSFIIEKPQSSKTLMSEIAGKNLVPLNSEKYNNGVKQFESNLDYILSRCTEENIPTLVGTLASNLMQPPLCKYAGCDSLSNKFDNIITDQGINLKDELTRIKENDKLRFRAPEKFNDIILELASKYNCEIVDVQKLFEDNSLKSIIGDELMMDHLHPNLKGNSLIAESIFQNIKLNEKLKIISSKVESMPVLTNYYLKTYTKLDSSFARLRIKHLKSDFPFVNKKDVTVLANSIHNIENSVAHEIIEGKLSWENAHTKLANYYLRQNELKKYVEELNVLIEDKPFDKYSYIQLIKTLEEKKEIELQKVILNKYHQNFPDLFSALKLGDIYFAEKNHKNAIFYYNICLKYSQNNAKIYFNLSASYFAFKDLAKSLQNISNCLNINPDYPNAKKIFGALMNISKSKK